MRAICVVLMLGLAACTHVPPTATPEQRTASVAKDVVVALSQLQAAAIQANVPGGLTDHDAVAVVKFTVASTKTIQQVPNGWYPAVKTAEDQVKAEVHPAPGSGVGAAFVVLDALLATAQTGGH